MSLSICLSVQAVTFELLGLGASFLVYGYILIISRSSLSIKVIGSRSNEKLTYFNLPVLYAWRPLKLTKRSRSSEGQGYTVSRSNEMKSVFCLFVNVFCDLCARRMVRLQLKGIRVKSMCEI